MTTTKATHEPIICVGCGQSVAWLEVFPGDRCMDCYRPEGERIAASMTADRLSRMWGARTITDCATTLERKSST